MNKTVKIAVDAMGGDGSPKKIIDGIAHHYNDNKNTFYQIFGDKDNKVQLQEIYDFIFRQLELSIREIGYGDQSINKKMKDYINLFYAMLDKIHDWDSSSFNSKVLLLTIFLDNNADHAFLCKYFDNYKESLSNNTLNFYIKGVIKT